MTQPRYDYREVIAWTNEKLAQELRQWADARERVSLRRTTEGKEPLDALLLREAATRLLEET